MSINGTIKIDQSYQTTSLQIQLHTFDFEPLLTLGMKMFPIQMYQKLKLRWKKTIFVTICYKMLVITGILVVITEKINYEKTLNQTEDPNLLIISRISL